MNTNHHRTGSIVSDERFTIGADHTTGDRPAHSFGQRAAALAGVVVSAGALAIGLAGPFGDSVEAFNTVCCPPHHDSSVV